MITLEQLDKAVTAAVKTALSGSITATVLGRELYDNIPRPSLKVVFGDGTLETYNGASYKRTQKIAVVYYPGDPEAFKTECMRVQQRLEWYFLLNMLDCDGEMVDIHEVNSAFSSPDGGYGVALVVSFTAEIYGEGGYTDISAPDSGNAEIMMILEDTLRV